MGRRIRVKPSKGQSVVGFGMGLVFCFIGLFVVIPTAGPFGILWTLMAVIITVTQGINAFSDKGIASHEITVEDETQEENGYPLKTSEERLKEVKELYEKGMITMEEYQTKREEILKEI